MQVDLWTYYGVFVTVMKLFADAKPIGDGLSEIWEELNGEYSSPEPKLVEETLKDCIEFRFEAGIFQVKSPGTSASTTCGLYLVGPPDTQVAVEFVEFDVECDNKGLVAVLDGWEQSGHIFPPVQDLQGRDHHRYETHCGMERPKGTFLSSGNMALIQYNLPHLSDGFTIKAVFLKNPRPCNVISLFPTGSFSLRNYGMRVNCSMLAIYPLKVSFSLVDVGVTSEIFGGRQLLLPERVAPPEVCDPYKGDYVEVRGGNTISVNTMTSFRQLCGMSDGADETFGVSCGSTVVRLVSSGHCDNTVDFDTDSLGLEGPAPADHSVCRLV